MRKVCVCACMLREAQFEECMINAKMETIAEMGPNEEGVCVRAC